MCLLTHTKKNRRMSLTYDGNPKLQLKTLPSKPNTTFTCVMFLWESAVAKRRLTL